LLHLSTILFNLIGIKSPASDSGAGLFCVEVKFKWLVWLGEDKARA